MVHTVPGIIDLEDSGIASGPSAARPETSASPKCMATLLSGQQAPCLTCLWIAACFYVCALYSTVAYCSTQILFAVEVPCQTGLKVFSTMLHML